MRPDIGVVRETSGLVRAILPWVKRFFDFRGRLEKRIDIDVASGSDAVWVDLGNTPHAIHVHLKVSNFSLWSSVKLQRVTGSIMMEHRGVVPDESVLVSGRVSDRQSTRVDCRFKLSDSQVRLLGEFSECRDLEARITIQVEMSSRWGTICKSMSNRDILVKSWYQPAAIQPKPVSEETA